MLGDNLRLQTLVYEYQLQLSLDLDEDAEPSGDTISSSSSLVTTTTTDGRRLWDETDAIAKADADVQTLFNDSSGVDGVRKAV